MTFEQLEKGKILIKEIGKAKENIKHAEYTQLENVVERESFLRFDGTEIVVPKSLFKIFGKLVLSEYNQKLIELEKEFNSL